MDSELLTTKNNKHTKVGIVPTEYTDHTEECTLNGKRICFLTAKVSNLLTTRYPLLTTVLVTAKSIHRLAKLNPNPDSELSEASVRLLR